MSTHHRIPMSLRRGAVALIAAAAAVGLTACSGDTQKDAAQPQTTTQTVTVPARTTAPTTTTTTTVEPAAPPPAAETTPPSVGGGGGGVMPSVVCMNLQAAQDLIQEQDVFFSRSHDATGQGRRQVLDRNWVVVEQSPAPGTPIQEGDADLGAVKIGEPSPC